MSNGAVPTLHASVGAIEVELPTAISTEVDGSRQLIQQCAQAIRFASAMSVYFRVMMGRQLIAVQQGALWQEYGLDGVTTWSKFLDIGFPQVAGLSRESAYLALLLAKCKIIAKLSPGELRRFENLSNAVELARLERRHLNPAEYLEAAMTLPVEEFRALVGKGKPGSVQVMIENQEVAQHLGRIANYMKHADPESLEAFWGIIEQAKLRAGDNPTDAMDCIIACCYHQWAGENEDG